jgi:tRNA (cmo5U34)-methyltransferase
LDADIDKTIPEGPWLFNDGVTKVFDNMLERSIPGFADMRSLTTQLACRYAQPGTFVLDLGCSRGGSLEPIIDVLGSKQRYLGVEISDPMRKAASERFVSRTEIDIKIIDMDLRLDFPSVESSVILSILTIQFIPIEYRQAILASAYSSLRSGGAFILVEKILGTNAHLNSTFVDLYYGMKGRNGYTEEEINSKRIALEGVLVPVTANWNEQLLKDAGFSQVECFWRNLNFAGWIAIK